jgi:hypothetical protein
LNYRKAWRHVVDTWKQRSRVLTLKISGAFW